MKHWKVGLAVIAAHATALVPQVLPAQDLDLPNPVVWTTYDTGGTYHANAVAISSLLKQRFGVNMRVLSAGNGMAQQSTLKLGRSDYVLAGFDVYFSQEGLFQFSARDWGPQPVRLVMTANDDGSYGLAVRPELNVQNPADLKGKRIAFVQGSAAIEQAFNALIMGCGGMTWDDVEKVEVPGFGPSVDAYVNGDVDVYYSSTTSATALKAEASPHGLAWVPIPHDDAECWSAIRATDPRWIKKIATEGASVPESGIEMAGYPTMIVNTMADREADQVYAMTKSFYDNFEDYKGSAPSAYGFALDRQLLSYVVPYHDGAIRYFKEQGLWTEENQVHNDKLIARQKALKEAWDNLIAQDISDDAEFAAAWEKARSELPSSM